MRTVWGMRGFAMWSVIACVAVTAVARSQGQQESLAGGVDYILGAGDMISIRALHVPEIPEAPLRIGDDGYLMLPLVGRVKAGDATVGQLARQVEALLSDVIKQPVVSVSLVEAKSHPVSVLGAVKNAGVYQILGHKRLLEVLSTAGGTADDAGDTVRISRPLGTGRIPVPGAQDLEGFSVATVSLPDLIEGVHPQHNILIRTGDVISVPRARLVYVVGEVHKAGGFVLRDRESMSVIQAISMAEGLTTVAGSRDAKILRRATDTEQRQEIPIDIKDILSGKTPDAELIAGDILFVPDSIAKNASLRVLETAIQMATGVVIWRR